MSPTTPLGVPLPSRVTGPMAPPQLDLMLPGTETALSTAGDPRHSWGGGATEGITGYSRRDRTGLWGHGLFSASPLATLLSSPESSQPSECVPGWAAIWVRCPSDLCPQPTPCPVCGHTSLIHSAPVSGLHVGPGDRLVLCVGRPQCGAKGAQTGSEGFGRDEWCPGLWGSVRVSLGRGVPAALRRTPWEEAVLPHSGMAVNILTLRNPARVQGQRRGRLPRPRVPVHLAEELGLGPWG